MPAMLWVLNTALVVAILFLLLCVAVVFAAGGPRTGIGSCPEGRIAIVTSEGDGRIVTRCR